MTFLTIDQKDKETKTKTKTTGDFLFFLLCDPKEVLVFLVLSRYNVTDLISGQVSDFRFESEKKQLSLLRFLIS